MSKTPSNVNGTLTQVVDALANQPESCKTSATASQRTPISSPASTQTNQSSPGGGFNDQDDALIGAIFESLHRSYPGSFKAMVAPNEQEARKNKQQWLTAIRQAGLTASEIKRALQAIALGDRPLDAKGNRPSNQYPPSLPEFIEIARPDRRMLGHASRRPAAEVLAEYQGTERGALPRPQDDATKARNRIKGQATLDSLRASLLGA